MYKIYHNPRCRKSREALLLLEDLGLKFLVVNYLTEPLSKSKLQEILVKIKLKPSQLIRKNEADWKALDNRKELNENQILDILIKYPKTIERPIVTSEDSGVLARPLENLITFCQTNVQDITSCTLEKVPHTSTLHALFKKICARIFHMCKC